MISAESVQTWIRDSVFDHPSTGEDPPLLYLHLRADKSQPQPVDRPYDTADDIGQGTDSDSDDTNDIRSDSSYEMGRSRGSERSYVSAGDKTPETFLKQLEKNLVYTYGTVIQEQLGLEDMEIETFQDTTRKLDASTLKLLTDRINLMYNTLQWGGPTDEARFQARLEPVLIGIVDPPTEDPVGLERYHVTSSVLWNRAPKVLLDNGWHNLSQPKVDVCFNIASEQSAEGPPLRNLSEEVDPNDSSKVAELLSLPTLANFLSDPGLAEVCFVPLSKIPQWSLYPISFFEIKSAAEDLAIARNQIVNAGVFQCGKQIDLMLHAERCAKERKEDFNYQERILSMGMAIAGTVWEIYVVYLPRDLFPSKPRFVHEKVVGGDWRKDVEGFIGAVKIMHQQMLRRIVQLLVVTYEVFEKYQAAKGKPVSPVDLNKFALPARTIPIPTPTPTPSFNKKAKKDQLKSVKEGREPDELATDELAKETAAKLNLGAEEEAVSE